MKCLICADYLYSISLQLSTECAQTSGSRFKNGNISELSMPVILPHFAVDETKLRDMPVSQSLAIYGINKGAL